MVLARTLVCAQSASRKKDATDLILVRARLFRSRTIPKGSMWELFQESGTSIQTANKRALTVRTPKNPPSIAAVIETAMQ